MSGDPYQNQYHTPYPHYKQTYTQKRKMIQPF